MIGTFLFPSFGIVIRIMNLEEGSKLGNLIAGMSGSLFSLAGVLLIYETFNRQRNQEIKNNVFEMIKLHRNNVEEMKYRNETGRNVFRLLLYDFNHIYEIVEKVIKEEQINIEEPDIINISYLIFFYGQSKKSDVQFDSVYPEYEKNKKLINLIRKEIAIWNKINRPLKKIADGHQLLLGHYYRHLFQAINYIDKQKIRNEDKKFYVKTLRVQLSNFEQVLFFYNSLSTLGEKWERKNNFKKKLISDYKLIKNIPFGFCGKIDPKKYYPLLKFEYEENNDNKRKNDV